MVLLRRRKERRRRNKFRDIDNLKLNDIVIKVIKGYSTEIKSEKSKIKL